MIEVNEQCKECFHFQVCATVLKNQLFIREKMLKEENPKCEHFIPASDVAEVKHGEWLYFECVASYDGAISGYGCSVCSAFVDEDVFDTDEFHKNYCGCCGAKMDIEKE